MILRVSNYFDSHVFFFGSGATTQVCPTITVKHASLRQWQTVFGELFQGVPASPKVTRRSTIPEMNICPPKNRPSPKTQHFIFQPFGIFLYPANWLLLSWRGSKPSCMDNSKTHRGWKHIIRQTFVDQNSKAIGDSPWTFMTHRKNAITNQTDDFVAQYALASILYIEWILLDVC